MINDNIFYIYDMFEEHRKVLQAFDDLIEEIRERTFIVFGGRLE